MAVAADKILNGLNPRQLEAVRDTVNQSALVIAGAGSGKTSVLTRRIAYLIANGVDPINILAVTFTNKASGEMKERVADMIGTENAKKLTMGTFHKICILMLKRFGERNGIPKNFSIADPSDQKQTMTRVLSNYGIDTAANTVNAFISKVSDLKNQMLTPLAYYDKIQTMPPEKQPEARLLHKVYEAYQNRLRRLNMLDFDDLLLEAVRLLKADKDTRKYYQSRYSYVMVDEYQDTNPTQYELIRLISGKSQCEMSQPNNTFVVGDDSQAIYGFRGSDLNIILGFEQDFPEARVVYLEQNYRSTKTVVNIGNAIIKGNQKQKEKTLFTDNKTGDKVKIVRNYDGEEEARFIAQEIGNLMQFSGYKPKDFAVLYRANVLSRQVEQELIKRRIPYHIVGGLSFYERMEIKDTLAYLKVIANPSDDIAMKRVLGNFPGIGKTTITRIEEQGAEYQLSLVDSFKNFKSSRKITQNAIDSLRQLLQELYMIYRVSLTENRKDPVTKMLDIVWKRTAYRERLENNKTKENESRIENLDELVRVAKYYEDDVETPTLHEFLDTVTLSSDSDNEPGNEVSLMTVHASKGLEFPVVFTVGMEEGIFPHKNALNEPDGLEEERRLMYVAVTRAKDDLYLTYTKQRSRYGSQEWNSPSRFLDEIPDELKVNL